MSNRAKRRAEAKWKMNKPEGGAKTVAEGEQRLQEALSSMPLTEQEKRLTQQVAASFLDGWEAYAKVRDSLRTRYGEAALLPFLVEVMEQGRAQVLARAIDAEALDSTWAAIEEITRAGVNLRVLRRPG